MHTRSQSPSDIKERIRTYWDVRSATFDQDIGHGADETESGLWKKYLREIIGPAPKKILDVGTGTGMIALNLAEIGHDVTGIDLGEKMMEIARQKADNRKLAVTFQVSDAEEPDFKDNTFDCIICRHLLWTLPHPEKAIREWIRISKDGGTIIAIDGHIKPHNYFPDIENFVPAKMENLAELWDQMYSKQVQEQLPFTKNLTIENLTTFFSAQKLSNVKYQCIDEISAYQKNLRKERGEVSDLCEVNVIWGTVRK